MSTTTSPAHALQDNPTELLAHLLRFDTSNPPGNERACIDWVRGLLDELGCEVKVLAAEPERPNLIARLPGEGSSPPLLLQGHVDVVAARGSWSHPPFAGEQHDGYIWGRGALDMKGGVAMMLAAFMRAKAAGRHPPGDVILCLMADEEAGSKLGADFLVREHPELFEGVSYAIGELGGFRMEVAGRSFYPVMVAEKQICWTLATLRGRAGHGSMPLHGGAMAALGQLLSRVDSRRMPVHVPAVTRMMVQDIAAELPTSLSAPLRGLLRPRLTDRLLDALGDRGRLFDPLLHNTVAATIVRGGDKINVIPGEVSVELDIRLLPGSSPEQAFAELRALSGLDLELELLSHDPAPAEPDMAMFGTLSELLRELDAQAKPVPLLLPGVTDGRFFSKLGIQTYGFLPMQLPPDLRFLELIHAEDERLPTAAVEFGTGAIERLLERF
ncbi:MAG TPA: M20/M25/M40 family metallo-hydrolase [Solirubrobacteraceae bacterium]|jgi:acetylornithine deacetylase/succinyl-diaminopimelate desuccinylase-like protein|nr:M20/M25/M40 family metallo-hydrolase [Solirubrobacteraceae bacterium]